MYNHYLLVNHGLKACAKCLNDKELDAFGFDKTRPDGLHVYCKECRSNDYKRKEVLPALQEVDRGSCLPQGQTK